MRAASTRDAPRLQGALDPQHDEVVVEEHGVDREAHERRVNGRGGAKEKPLPALELRSPEKAFQTGERPVRHDAALTERAPVRFKSKLHEKDHGGEATLAPVLFVVGS